MPTKWPHKAALMGWFGISGSGSLRVEPPLTRAQPLPDPSLPDPSLPDPFLPDPSFADPPLTMLEHFATPGEFMGERDAALAAGQTERLALLDGSLTGIDLAKFAEPQPFRRIAVASGATLYRGPRGRRRLLIGFGGRGAWIGPPMPVFLQCIDATRWDVLILRDPELCHFRNGVAGIGRTFASVINWLGPKAARYQHVTCMGYSAGGLAAVWAGLALGADRVVCVSGQRPQDVNRLFAKTRPPSAFDAACACLDASVSRPVAFLHAAAHADDAAFARSLAAQTGGMAAGAVGYNMHSLLGYMWMRGHLQPFLDLALTAPLDAKLQQRLTTALRTPALPYLTARPDQIPPVAKGVTPDGD